MNWQVSALETHTLLVAIELVCVVAAVVWLGLAAAARLAPSASWTLAGANLATAATLLLRSHRGDWPDLLSAWPADCMAVLAFALLRAAIPAIARRALAWRLPVAVLLVAAVLMAAVPYQGDLRWQAMIVTWSAALLAGVAAWDAYRLIQDSTRRPRLTLAFSWPLMLIALLMAGRGVDLLVYLERDQDVRLPSAFNYLFLWGGLLLAMLQNANMGFLVLMRMILRIRELAEHDVLTGVYNRGAFESQLERSHREFLRGRPYAVVMIDMDRFKKLNDTLGHAAGDAALQRLLEAVRPCVREVDKLGRLGGEEFGVILVDTELAGAALVAERMRALIAECRFEWMGMVWPLSASFGIAEALPEDPSGEAVLARADAGLYRAKAQGRNLVQAMD